MSKSAQESSVEYAITPLDAKEHMMVFGPEELSHDAILGLALGKSAQDAHVLLESIGGLSKLEGKTIKELRDLHGMGKASAIRLVASLELYRRCHVQTMNWSVPLRCPQDVADFVRAKLRAKTQECFVAVGLDSRRRMILFRTLTVGSIAEVNIHPRELFRPLIREGVHSVILAHNHPSGDCSPSESDVELTRRMCEVGRLVGIPVLDHLVVTDHDYRSLVALGLIEN